MRFAPGATTGESMYIDLSLPVVVDAAALQTRPREDALMRLGHMGTHLDRPLLTDVPLEYFQSRALKVDVSAFCSKRAVELADLPADAVLADDFVLLHTGRLRCCGYGSRAYLDAFFELAWEAIDFLAVRQVRFIGIDSRGIRMNQDHPRADRQCEQQGVYVIENMANMEQLPSLVPFTIYTAVFPVEGTGVPCRVIAQLS
jgi:kynurenine formamidase